MEISRNRVDRGTKKQSESLGIPSAVTSALGVDSDFDLHNLHRLDSASFASRKNKEAVDAVFQSLLADANDDLANLLRDLHAWPQTVSPEGALNSGIRDLLIRAIRCAAKQYMLQAELGSLALTDELTSLYNRRGFQALAERQLKLARRTGRDVLLFFVDLDGLKNINDSLGHCEGDLALKCTAGVLKSTFRDSDILSRLGGDEFAVLALEASGRNEACIRARLQQYLEAANVREPRYDISLSVGVARFDHRNPVSVRDLMAQADEAMYLEKRRPSIPRLVTLEEKNPA